VDLKDLANIQGLSIYDTVKIPTIESIKLPSLTPPPNGNLASEFYKRLLEWINKFSNSLDSEHEVGVRLVSFGQSIVFHLEDMSWWNPSLMKFIGRTDDGEPVELIQHVSQISILLMKLPRLDPTKPKVKIGFAAKPDESEGA